MSSDLTHVPVVDDVVIERLRALRDQVARPGEDVLGDLLKLFVGDTRDRVEAIRAAVSNGDAEARRQAAHALKGSALNMGAKRVAQVAAFVEKNPATGADVDSLVAEVAAALAALEQRLT